MYMNNIISGTLIVVILLSACKSQQVVGEYKYSQNLLVHHLEILNDSSFVYLVESDLYNDETEGKWNYKGGKLYLSSFKEYMPYQVDESSDDIDRVLITLKDMDDLIISGNYVCLNQSSEKFYVSDEGVITIAPYQEIKVINVFSLKGPFKYDVINTKSNRFNITYDSGESSDLYFLNEKFKVSRDKLLNANDEVILKRQN